METMHIDSLREWRLEFLLTAAASDATNWQLVLAAAV